MSESKIELIAKLLAKAESTTPEEAEALTEHADRTAGGRRGRSRNAAVGGAASADGYVAGKNANTSEKGLSQGRGISA